MLSVACFILLMVGHLFFFVWLVGFVYPFFGGSGSGGEEGVDGMSRDVF